MNCHAGEDTGFIPGLVVKSMLPGPGGGSLDSFRQVPAGHGVPFETRFGGWHLTGAAGFSNHWGNLGWSVGTLTAAVGGWFGNTGARWNCNHRTSGEVMSAWPVEGGRELAYTPRAKLAFQPLVVSPDHSLQKSTDKDDHLEPVPCGQFVVPDGLQKFGERLAGQVNQSPQVAVFVAKSTKIADDEIIHQNGSTSSWSLFFSEIPLGIRKKHKEEGILGIICRAPVSNA